MQHWTLPINNIELYVQYLLSFLTQIYQNFLYCLENNSFLLFKL